MKHNESKEFHCFGYIHDKNTNIAETVPYCHKANNALVVVTFSWAIIFNYREGDTKQNLYRLYYY